MPSPDRLDPPPGPRWCDRRSGGPRGLAGNGRRPPPARPRAPEEQPGALQEHHRRPGEARSRAQGEARGASAGRPPPHRGEGGPPATHSQGAGGEGPPRQETAAPHRLPGGQKVGARGRAGVRTPPLPRTAMGRRRGARGRSEKSGPIRKECPSLVRRGLGPARESTTSPHRSARGGGAGRTPHHLRPVLRARAGGHTTAGPTRTRGRGSESDTAPRGWPWTHSSRRAQARGARPSLSCDGEAGGNRASGCSPWKPRETRGPSTPASRQPLTRERRVHTYLVAQTPSLGQNNDGRRRRGCPPRLTPASRGRAPATGHPPRPHRCSWGGGVGGGVPRGHLVDPCTGPGTRGPRTRGGGGPVKASPPVAPRGHGRVTAWPPNWDLVKKFPPRRGPLEGLREGGRGGAGRARDGSGRSPATSRALGKRRKRIRSRGRDPRAHASQPAPLGAPPRRSSAHGPPHPGATATQKTGRRKGRPPPGTHAGRHAAGPGRPTPARTGGAAFRVPSPGVGTWRKKAAEAPRTNGRTPGATAAGAAEP